MREQNGSYLKGRAMKLNIGHKKDAKDEGKQAGLFSQTQFPNLSFQQAASYQQALPAIPFGFPTPTPYMGINSLYFPPYQMPPNPY